MLTSNGLMSIEFKSVCTDISSRSSCERVPLPLWASSSAYQMQLAWRQFELTYTVGMCMDLERISDQRSSTTPSCCHVIGAVRQVLSCGWFSKFLHHQTTQTDIFLMALRHPFAAIAKSMSSTVVLVLHQACTELGTTRPGQPRSDAGGLAGKCWPT